MSINLSKGQKVSLSKEKTGGKGLTRVMVGLGWDEAVQGSKGFFKSLFGAKPATIDCDASAILCGLNGKIVSRTPNECCVYYGNLRHPSGAIVHQGDNLTGEGEGDDEQIMVDLLKVPQNIYKIVFVVNIYDADVKHQHFGLINNAFIRLVDMDNQSEICRFNLSENYDNMTGMIVGELNRSGDVWEFNAIGQPVREASRVDALLKMYQ